MLNRSLTLLLLVLLTGAPSLAVAAPACASVLLTTETNEGLTSNSPKTRRFLDLLDSGLRSRALRAPEVQALARELGDLRIGGSTQALTVRWPKLHGELKLSATANTLSITVPRLVIQDDASSTGLALGSRPQGLNPQFSKFLVALTEGMRRQAAQDHGLRQVDLVAGNVVNRGLIALLKETGFSLQPQAPVSRHDDFGPFDAGLRHAYGFRAHLRPGAREFNSPGAASEIARNWVLRFEITRPEPSPNGDH